MEALIIIALILAGLLLFIVEVFLIPGISIAGIASAICILYANYYAFFRFRAGSRLSYTGSFSCGMYRYHRVVYAFQDNG